eukprot:INCI470.1.p1 GENE.INCI470.1~~INCI470.1.p1  ORF type:complete len:721 (-),score=131.06 INCI470.1:63-2225(-)
MPGITVTEEALAEIQALQAIYGQDDLTFETSGLEAAVESVDTGFLEAGQDLRFTVTLTDGGGGRTSVSCTVEPNYPQALPRLNVEACGSLFSTSQLESLNREAAKIVAAHEEDFADGAGLFSVFQDFAEVLAERQSPAESCAASSHESVVKGSETAGSASIASSGPYKRVMFWTHHVRVKHKTCVYPAGKKHDVIGLCVLGKPGFIFAEGLVQNVEAFIKDVKSQRWKRILVKFEETGASRYFSGSGFQELSSPEQMFSILRQHGRNDIIDAAIGVEAAGDDLDTARDSSANVCVGAIQRRIIRIDHMNDSKSYIALLQSWGSELELSGRIFFHSVTAGPRKHAPPSPQTSGRQRVEGVYVVLEAQGITADSKLAEFEKRLRTNYVDVNSKGFRCKERKSTVICAISAPSPHFAAGTFVAEEYQPEEKQSILELVANLAMKPASPDKASDPSELQFSSSSDQGQSTDQGEQGMDQAESNDAIIVATDIPWKILKAALRASLKREKFQEQNSRGGGAKRRGRASSSGQDEKNCFVQRQPPFCVVELCVDNHHAPISDSPNKTYDVAKCVSASVTGLTEADMALIVSLDLTSSIEKDQSSPGSGFAKTFLESVSKALFHASEACDSVQAEEDVSSGGGEVDFSDRCRSKLPQGAELAKGIWGEDSGRSINAQRQLRIMTWGDRLMKAGAVNARGSQWNINAKPLNGRGGGANVHRNALQARQ